MKKLLLLLLSSVPKEVSSRPERTRISCHAAMDMPACAPFCKGEAHEINQRHQVPQEIRGSAVEGSAVPQTSPGNVFRQYRSEEAFRQSIPLPEWIRDYRFSTAVYFTGYSAPMYSARGRISRLSSSCSITCAAQPEILLTANIGVKRSRSIPSMVYVEAE
jgi:hypothetical protein